MLEIYPNWQGLPLIPSKAAMNELYKFGLTLEDVKQVLEEGQEVSKKRKKDVIEKTLAKKNKAVKVVISKSHNYSFDIDCWIVVHIGIIKR